MLRLTSLTQGQNGHFEKVIKFYIKRQPFESRFQRNKRRAISSFLAQVMPVLVKCVWLAEGISTCRKSLEQNPILSFRTEGFGICRVGHLDMSKGTWGGPHLPLFTSKTPIAPSKLKYHLSQQLKPMKNPLEIPSKHVLMTRKQSRHELIEFLQNF